jgi:hypothetical protein
MAQFKVNISDIIDQLGVLFANLLEDYPFEDIENENQLSTKTDIENEPENPTVSSTEVSICIPAPVHDVSSSSSQQQYGKTVCFGKQGSRAGLEEREYQNIGWRFRTIRNPDQKQGALQIISCRCLNEQSRGNFCTGSFSLVTVFKRLEPSAGTLCNNQHPDYRRGWDLPAKSLQRPTPVRFERNNVSGRIALNKSPPAWGQIK